MADPWLTVTENLISQTWTSVLRALGTFQAGGLSEDETVGVIAAQIATGQRRAVSANDVLLATELARMFRRDISPVGLAWMETADDQMSRIAKAVVSVVTDRVDYVEEADPDERKALHAHSVSQRMSRLVEGQVTNASQWSRGEAAIRHQEAGVRIAGWYRRLSPGACNFCQKLGGFPPENNIHALSHRIAGHKSGPCKCSQAFVSELLPGQKWLGTGAELRAAREAFSALVT